MRSNTRHGLENLLDYLSSIEDGKAIAFPYQCLANVVDHPEVPYTRHKPHKARAIAIVNTLRAELEAQGYYVQAICFDRKTESGKPYSTPLGRTMQNPQLIDGCEYTVSECESLVSGAGRITAGWVIGRGKGTWPAAGELSRCAHAQKITARATNRLARHREVGHITSDMALPN
jgi:hypothetical protein